MNNSLENVHHAVAESCILDADLARSEFRYWETLLNPEISSKKDVASGRILHVDFIDRDPNKGCQWRFNGNSFEVAEREVLEHSCQNRFVVNGDTSIFNGGIAFTGQFYFKIPGIVNGV